MAGEIINTSPLVSETELLRAALAAKDAELREAARLLDGMHRSLLAAWGQGDLPDDIVPAIVAQEVAAWLTAHKEGA